MKLAYRKGRFWDFLFTPLKKNSGLTLARLFAALPFFIGIGIILWVAFRAEGDPLNKIADDLSKFSQKVGPDGLSLLVGGFALFVIGLVFVNTVRSLERSRRAYARHFNRAANEAEFPAAASEIGDDIRLELSDLSTPENLFVASRQRLLDEAIRLDALSKRNLILGVMFSMIALFVLAWPLIAAVIQETHQVEVVAWVTQYYLPRFAVGVLLQFVGFFFLRLYVSNELDLKHNKNEITNIEMRMMAAQLAQTVGDNAAKKDVIKSFAATERNFLLKKGERTISTEALSEYNDMKGLLEKLASKLRSRDSD
jgi:uncharacterized membrane protein